MNKEVKVKMKTNLLFVCLLIGLTSFAAPNTPRQLTVAPHPQQMTERGGFFHAKEVSPAKPII